MKKYFVLILLLLLNFNIYTEDLIINIDKSNLFNNVKFLTSLPDFRNHTNLDSLNLSSDYIKNKFIKIGLITEEEIFIVNNNKYKNIIGKINSNKKNIIIIGAHYDVYGNQVGADDNASGIAGLLELARTLKRNENLINNQIIFIAYSLEEPPYFNTQNMGSYINAKGLYNKKIKIKYMICLEMIGYFSNNDIQEYPLNFMKLIYPKKGNFIALVGRTKEKNILKRLKKIYIDNTNITCETLATPVVIPGIDLSDHKNYWKFGYNAIMITDTSYYRNKNYHKESDTINTLDFDKMKEVIKGLSYFVIKEE